MQPILTIFCPFTRHWAIDLWIEQFEAVEHDPALTNLCFVIDVNEPYILNMLKKYAKRRGYRSFHVKINEDNYPNEVRIAVRRQRVAEVHNQSKDLIAKTDGDIIIGLEDDTDMSRLPSFERLYKPLLQQESVGFVEGVAMGRWGASIIGAWDSDDVFRPKEVKTMLPPTDSTLPHGYQDITAGGFYGYATRRSLYMNHEYHSSSAHPYGPDVVYGFYVRQQGFRCLVDWQTILGHRDYQAVLWPDEPTAKLTQVVYNKDIINGKWNRTDYEQR